MYKFHFDTIKVFYKELYQVLLLYTDTDTFIYNIQTDDVYKDMLHPFIINEFDFSSEPSNAIQFADAPNFAEIRKRNMKILGKLKDEFGEYRMDEFVGLRSKSYSYTMQVQIVSKPLDDTQFYTKSEIQFQVTNMYT